MNTTSGNGGFTPLINSAVYATTKAAVTTHHRVPLGSAARDRRQGRRVVALPVDAHAGHAQHRHLAAGREPARPLRPTRGTADRKGRDALGEYQRRMDAAGLPVVFAPLSEVADLCFEGIRDDVFWMTYPERSRSRGRSEPAPSRRWP